MADVDPRAISIDELDPEPMASNPTSRGKSYARPIEDVRLDLAYAIGEHRRSGTPIMDTLTTLARARHG